MVTFLSYSVFNDLILRHHEETLKLLSLLSKQRLVS